MKRILLESAKVFTYKSGDIIERLGFMSAIAGITVTAADAGATAKIYITECDTEAGTYVSVVDEFIFLDETKVEKDAQGVKIKAFTEIPVATGDQINVDIDLEGCDQYIKIDVAYTGTVTAELAVVIGDGKVLPA